MASDPQKTLRERLLAAKLAGTTVPDLVADQVSVHRYRFRSNEQAADLAQHEFAAWLRDKAATIDFHVRYRADFPRSRGERQKDIADIQYAARLKLLADEIDLTRGDGT